jgi:hypothetical protein
MNTTSRSSPWNCAAFPQSARWSLRPNQIVDLDGLFVTNQRDNTETQRLARVVLLLLRLLHCCRQEWRDCRQFLAC